MTIEESKANGRALGLAARARAPEGAQQRLAAHLDAILADHRGAPLAGYMAMRGEADPLPALTRASAHGPVGLPVVMGKGTPLRFRRWTQGAAMARGAFGTMVPREGAWMTPRILVVPLVAFDRRGGRLGYGGGFYDRTLQELRAEAPVLAIGLGFAAQELPEVPLEPTDQRLDLVVTEDGPLDLPAIPA